MAKNRDVWVFSERMSLLVELISAGRVICEKSGGSLGAIVLGKNRQAGRAIEQGADWVYWLGERPIYRLVDDYLPTIAGLVERQHPRVIIVGSTKLGRAIAGRLGARLGVSAITDVRELFLKEDQIEARHMIYGGGAVRIEKSRREQILLTVGPGVFRELPPETGRKGDVIEIPFVEPHRSAILRESKPRTATSVNLSSARKVICLGRGIARKEDLAQMEKLAHLLGAEIGCSRPLAEGLDWLPRERYIGISGAQIKPDLYLGVGVSGQVQHMIGMNGSRVVAAINRDPQAPIFTQADYGIVGDLYEIVPALIKAISEKGS